MIATSRIALYWFAFVALVGVTLYGLGTNLHILRDAWTGAGSYRFLVFAGGYTVAAAAIYVLAAPRLPAILALVVSISACATGIGGPVAAGSFLFASMVLGRALLFRDGAGRAIAPVDMLLSLLTGASIYMTAVGLTAAVPIHYPALHAAAVALPLVVFPAQVRECLGFFRKVLGPRRWSGPWEYLNFALFAFILIGLLICVLLPQVNSDAVVAHLAIPSQMAIDHAWSFDVARYLYAVMPAGAAWMITPAYLLGGEYAARLLNFGFYVLTTLLIFTAARRFLSAGTAWLVVVIFASTPLFQLETGNIFSENIWVALLFGGAIAMDRFRATGEARYFLMTGLLAGASIAVKVLGAVVAALVFFAAGLRCLKRPGLLAAGGLLAALSGLYPYLWAFVKTGNPVFPFMNNVFKSPYYAPSTFVGLGRTTVPNPYDLTFHTLPFADGGARDGSAGFALLVLLPIAFLSIRRAYPFLGWFSLVALIAGLFSEFRLAEVNLRYMYFVVPFAMVAIAIAYGQIQAASKALFAAMCGFGLVATLVNTYAMPVSGWAYRDFPLPMALSRTGVDQRRDEGAPERRLIDYLNLTRGRTARVAFFSRPMLVDLKGDGLFTNWYNFAMETELRQAASVSADAVFQLMKDRHVTHFIAFAPESGLINMYPAVDEFLRRYTEREFSAGDAYLARLKEPFRFANEVVKNGDFAGGASEWAAIGSVPGGSEKVVVTGSGGYRQYVAIDDRLVYRYSLKARCAAPDMRLRLEIDWLNAEGRTTTDLVARACDGGWLKFTRDVAPPAGSTGAYLTLLGFDAEKVVEISDVSLKW